MKKIAIFVVALFLLSLGPKISVRCPELVSALPDRYFEIEREICPDATLQFADYLFLSGLGPSFIED